MIYSTLVSLDDLTVNPYVRPYKCTYSLNIEPLDYSEIIRKNILKEQTYKDFIRGFK